MELGRTVWRVRHRDRRHHLRLAPDQIKRQSEQCEGFNLADDIRHIGAETQGSVAENAPSTGTAIVSKTKPVATARNSPGRFTRDALSGSAINDVPSLQRGLQAAIE